MFKIIPTVLVLAGTYLTFEAPDKPVKVERIQLQNKGDSFEAVISVKGDFPIHYQWYKNSQPIAGANHSSIMLDKFLVSGLKGGEIYCRVSNCGSKYEAIGTWDSNLDLPAEAEVYPVFVSERIFAQDVRR